MYRKQAGLVLAATLGACLWCASPGFPQGAKFVVKTASGKVRGVARASGGAEFLGIPYAQPPVGNLRWREPAPAKSWKGVRDAGAFGAPCSQPVLGDWNKHDAETSREDCLFLNVITPVWPAKEPLPVMLWLHGGANKGGTASSELYKNGTLICHGVLLVTVNYRLGVFGFYAHPALTRESAHHASGNYGLMDQIAALDWVRKNIANFGGDPARITVFGQSAGAMDTSLLMTSPLSKDRFQRAIAQSGSVLIAPPVPLAGAESVGEKLAGLLGVPSGDAAVAHLRAIPAEGLLKALGKLDPKQAPRFGPIVDGWVIPRRPPGVFAAGEQSAIPMIIGSTTREFSMTATPDELRKIIENLTGDLAPEAFRLYGVADGASGEADPLYGTVANQWSADFTFRCPATTQAAWHNAAQHPTFTYQFEHAIPGQEADGAVHSSDLLYVFGFYPKSGNISGNFNGTDFKLAELIETYWTNFAKQGNPNGPDAPNWPEFDGSQVYLAFTQDGRAVASSGPLRKPQCDLYREVLKRLMAAPEPRPSGPSAAKARRPMSKTTSSLGAS